jgi:hypothetical protein
MKEASQIQRTRLGELMFDQLAGIPLTAECVFYSPKYLKGDIEKEVCDFLLVLKGQAILVSMKAQEDPTAHTGDRLERWLVKSTDKAVKQAHGAVRTIRERPFWCDHSRRGRVTLGANSLNVIHAVVISEIIGQTVELPDSFPLSIGSIPVSYFSVNDFGNLVNELRAFYDIDAYLQARRSMPVRTQRTIGDEMPFYKYYILNDQSLANVSATKMPG